MKKKNSNLTIIVILLACIAFCFAGCVATDHGHCRPEYMVGYGDKR